MINAGQRFDRFPGVGDRSSRRARLFAGDRCRMANQSKTAGHRKVWLSLTNHAIDCIDFQCGSSVDYALLAAWAIDDRIHI